MQKRHVVTLEILLLGAFVAAGCGSSSPAKDGGSGGGTGGSDAGGGAGGTNADSGADHATGGGGGGGSGGATVDAPVDMGDGGPCITTFGAANPVQFAFDGGVNGGWSQYRSFDGANSMFTTSLGASYTDGNSCPGALQLAANFTTYGSNPNGRGEGAATAYYYGTAGNGAKDWSAYKALHAWIKVNTANFPELYGVYFFVESSAQVKYQDGSATGAVLSDGGWHPVVVDLTVPGGAMTGVLPTDINQIGFQVVLQSAPPAGASATPSPIFLLVDDLWLEAKPPSDAGADALAPADASGDGATGG